MEESMKKLILTLTIIGVISALVLSFVYTWTTPHIKKHQAQAKEEAIFTVLPEAEEFKTVEKEGKTFYEGYDSSGTRTGVACIIKGGGFQGMIEIMIGTDPEAGKIYNIKILEHQETPGLGARITEDQYKSNFEDKPFGDYEVIKKEATDPYQVEAISGATISSEKVTAIVEKGVERIQSVYGGGGR